jgi:hypothetical protein
MTTNAGRSTEQKISSATQDFIRPRLPAWLSRASVSQIADLRARFKAHRASQAQLRERMAQLQPLQTFAEQVFTNVLVQALPEGVTFAELEWRVVKPRIDTTSGGLLARFRYDESRRNGLLRLMSNFPAGTDYDMGTGLVAPGKDAVLSGSPGDVVATCRSLDVGAKYQEELERVFTDATRALLADDKRTGFALACKVATLQGEIEGAAELALREVADGSDDLLEEGLRGYPGLLEVLGQPVADGMLITLKNKKSQVKGVVLYLPGDPVKALRLFKDTAAMEQAMATQLQSSAYRQAFSQLISLDQRPGFIEKLNLRLRDSTPDLQMQGRVQTGSVFVAMANEQVQRVKDDARLLLVPTAQADAQAANQRLEAWKAAGMSLVNLAGFFIPVVGAMLLGQLLVQTLSEVYEGVVDLAEGHQHEALEHFFDVLETVLVGAATVTGGALLHNAFVETMEPVSLGARGQRLWSGELSPYQSRPESATLGTDGLYTLGTQRWLRSGARYFEVHRPEPNGVYRLRHPLRDDAYGPVVIHNGERCWRLLRDQPGAWHDSAHMLDTLWPQHPAVTAERAEQILQVAGVDQDELRGILMENRPAPLNLRETLRRFEQDARIDRFFGYVRSGQLPQGDVVLLEWCEAQADVGKGLADVAAHEDALRGPLLEHLTALPASDDALLPVLKRDFVGLPEAYARELSASVSSEQRAQAVAAGKLPGDLALRAASLLRVARLSRALEGLYLTCAYSDETGALVMALLARDEPASVSLELREGDASGRLIGGIAATDDGVERKVLVHSQGRFQAYDTEGHPLPLPAQGPADIFQAIADTLSAQQLAELGASGGDAAGKLRAHVIEQVPVSAEGIASVLGWAPRARWFNPGRRMEDGRVGYPLSGRVPARMNAGELLRAGVRRYFPGLSEAQVDALIERLMRVRGSAYQVLADLQDDHEQLELALNRWVGSESNDASRLLRTRLAGSLRRAWGAQAEPIVDAQGSVSGQRLHLVSLNVSTLPELPLSVSFDHLTALVLNETPLTHVPAQFLQAFTALRELNLSNNRLLRIPEGLGYLVELRELRLRHNSISPDAASLAQLQSLARLTHLDLSHNPLGQYSMRYSRLPQLVQLRLQNCRLGAWPQGISLCGFLEEADLRDNQLVGVPQEVRDMPYEFRRSLLVDGNPIGSRDLQVLHALDVIPEEPLLAAEVSTDYSLARDWWVGTDQANSATRSQYWQQLSTGSGSDMITLLERLMPLADFAWPRAVMVEQAWSLLTAMQSDQELQGAVYRLAAQRPTNENTIMDCFSQMLVHRLRNQAAGAGAPGEGAVLYNRGRSLFRLEQVERIARQDIALRNQQRDRIDAQGIRLAYRVRLRQWLRLPGQPRAMRNSDLNRVSSEQVLEARRRVRSLETREAMTIYLSQRPFWQGFLARHYRAAFEAMTQRYTERLQLLEAQRPLLEAGQYEAQAATLEQERLDDLQALRQSLSEQFIRGLERGLG